MYEDDDVLAFLTIAPETPGHTLVIPKKHVRNILDCPPATLAAVMKGVQTVAAKLIADGATAIKIIQNNEKPLQEVFHLHVHVIPY